MSKIVCVYHSIDLDGWMSAAIVKHWYEKEHYGNTLHHGNAIVDPNEGLHSLTFIGYNYGQPIPDLSEYDEVIMCDISFPPDVMLSLYNILEDNFIWLDHHISAINNNVHVNRYAQGERAVEFAACEITWMWFFPNETMPEIVRLLGLYDSFRHKGTDEEEKVLGFQYGARQKISNHKEAYEWLTMCLDHSEICNEIQNAGDEIYEYLCTEAKQAYKNRFDLFFRYSPKITEHLTLGFTEDVIYKFICINKERFNPINFGIDYHKDGYDGAACFHYANDMWNFSLYNDNGEVDCSQIAKQYGGGGHKGAAGFKLNNEQLLKLINK